MRSTQPLAIAGLATVLALAQPACDKPPAPTGDGSPRRSIEEGAKNQGLSGTRPDDDVPIPKTDR